MGAEGAECRLMSVSWQISDNIYKLSQCLCPVLASECKKYDHHFTLPSKYHLKLMKIFFLFYFAEDLLFVIQI